jgi:Na+:H+ antiporter, NhaA family
MAPALHRITHHPAFPGLLLMLSAAAAMIVANSAWAPAYDSFLARVLTVKLDGVGIEKPLALWINDGLMAIFFFIVGLELKREMVEGKLKNPRDVLLPGMAAVGGMAVPALIFVAINWQVAANLNGWAIPAATDIAFALGVLALAGNRVPASLKVFLLTLAILDDMGAIIIIAVFYTANLNVGYLLAALVPLALLIALNLRGQHRMAPMILLGAVLWYCMLKSGVHATLAGVITAMTIPLKDRFGKSPAHALEHALHPYVAFLIVPIFAFANAGVVLEGMTFQSLLQPLPLGIAAGLFLGKLIGVLGMTWLVVTLGIARKPHGATWMHILGVAFLAGIGFTMSLFIGSLSFADPAMMNDVRAGVLSGSILSAIVGFSVLMLAGVPEEARSPAKARAAV